MTHVAMIVWNEFRHDARVLKEAETLQAAGYEVCVHALHTPGRTERSETLPSGVRVERVLRSPFYALRQPPEAGNGLEKRPAQMAPSVSLFGQLATLVPRSVTHLRLLWRMVRSRPHVIHAHDVNTLPTAWLAACIVGCPLVYDAHEISTDREGYRKLRKAVGWIEKRLMPLAAATITTTDARATFFARAYGVPRPLVLQNRPRLEHPERTSRLRDELGLSEPWPIVLYQGGLQLGRGLHLLVDAMRRVENAYLVMIGGGRLAGSLMRQVDEEGLAGRVRFVPTVPLSDLPSYTASADIGVQPIENTCLNHLTTDSNKLFEYMMAGLPVVASSLPEIRRVVGDGHFGLLVRPGDGDSLAEALARLVDDPALRQGLAANALTAARTLNWDAQEAKLLDLYDGLVRSSRGGTAPTARG